MGSTRMAESVTLATTPQLGQVVSQQQIDALNKIKAEAAKRIAELNKKNATFSKHPIDCKGVCKQLHDLHSKRTFKEKDKVDVKAEGQTPAGGAGDTKSYEGETSGEVQDGSYKNPDGSTTYYQNAIVPQDTTMTSESEQKTDAGPDVNVGVVHGTAQVTNTDTQSYGFSIPWSGPPPGAP